VLQGALEPAAQADLVKAELVGLEELLDPSRLSQLLRTRNLFAEVDDLADPLRSANRHRGVHGVDDTDIATADTGAGRTAAERLLSPPSAETADVGEPFLSSVSNSGSALSAYATSQL
jgi:hypothetical protein